MQSPIQQQSNSSNTIMYIFIGIITVALVFILFFKKETTPAPAPPTIINQAAPSNVWSAVSAIGGNLGGIVTAFGGKNNIDNQKALVGPQLSK